MRISLVGHHDGREGREGRSPAGRDAIALARAQAVHRYLVEVMHRPPAKYEVRLAGPDETWHDDSTPASRARSRSVALDLLMRCSGATCQPVMLADP